MRSIIVSRHPAAVKFIAAELGGFLAAAGDTDPTGGPPVIVPGEHREIPVLAVASVDDVRGAIVYGNLPLHLACHAACVVAIEFAGPAPRGQEYTIEDMRAAGARLVRYGVLELPATMDRNAYLASGGFAI